MASQDCDRVVGCVVPVDEEGRGAWIEEGEARRVHRRSWVREHLRIQGAPELVRPEDVHAPVGVIASKRLGAERIILLGNNPERITLGRELGATDVVRERGEEAVERVRELTGGLGAHSVLECVGLEQAVVTALEVARPGGAIGRVGVPEHDTTATGVAFWKNASIAGGPAPVRAYIEELLPDVLEGRIEPGRVFDRTGSLDEVPDGYRAMNEREILKFQLEL